MGGGWCIHHRWYTTALVYYVFSQEIFSEIGRLDEFESLRSQGEGIIQAMNFPLKADQEPFSKIGLVNDLVWRNLSLVGLFQDDIQKVYDRYPFWKDPSYQHLVALVSKNAFCMNDLRTLLSRTLYYYYLFVRVDTFALKLRSQFFTKIDKDHNRKHLKHFLGMAVDKKGVNQHCNELLKICKERLSRRVKWRLERDGFEPAEALNEPLMAKVRDLQQIPVFSRKLDLLDSKAYKHFPNFVNSKAKNLITQGQSLQDKIDPSEDVKLQPDPKQQLGIEYNLFYESNGKDNYQELLKRLDEEFDERRTWTKEKIVLALLLENEKTPDSYLTNKVVAQKLGFSESSVERYRNFLKREGKRIMKIWREI